jgi:hypothetical protein
MPKIEKDTSTQAYVVTYTKELDGIDASIPYNPHSGYLAAYDKTALEFHANKHGVTYDKFIQNLDAGTIYSS